MQKIRTLIKKLTDERGDLAEELLILPLKIFILIFMVEMGFLMINYQFFAEGFGTAMRTAEIRGGVDETVEDATRSHLQNLTKAIDVEAVTVTGTSGPVEYGDPIEVEMSYTYHYMMIDPMMKIIHKETQFHPRGNTTSSLVIR